MESIVLYLIEIVLLIVIFGIIKKIASCMLKLVATIVVAVIMAALYLAMAS